jgi:acetyl esterase/lipase
VTDDREVTDRCYAAPDGEPLLARIYRAASTPAAAPVVVDLHPGAWTDGDRTAGETYDTALARRGFVVVAVDFRQAPAVTHPAASEDVATALRWVRASADDPPVRAVVAHWPPADPLARYAFVLERLAGDLTEEERRHYEHLRRATERYFGDQATMGAASAARLAVGDRRGPPPPLLVVRAELDANVPAAIVEDLVSAWRGAGGSARLDVYAGQPHAFGHRPGLATDRLVDAMAEFLAGHLAG